MKIFKRNIRKYTAIILALALAVSGGEPFAIFNVLSACAEELMDGMGDGGLLSFIPTRNDRDSDASQSDSSGGDEEDETVNGGSSADANEDKADDLDSDGQNGTGHGSSSNNANGSADDDNNEENEDGVKFPSFIPSRPDNSSTASPDNYYDKAETDNDDYEVHITKLLVAGQTSHEVTEGSRYAFQLSFDITSKTAGVSFAAGDSVTVESNIGELFSADYPIEDIKVVDSGKVYAVISVHEDRVTFTFGEGAEGNLEMTGLTITFPTEFTARKMGATAEAPIEKNLYIGNADCPVIFKAPAPPVEEGSSPGTVDMTTFWKNGWSNSNQTGAGITMEVNPIGSMDLYGSTTYPANLEDPDNPKRWPKSYKTLFVEDTIPEKGFIDTDTVLIYAVTPTLASYKEDFIDKWHGNYDIPKGTYYAMRAGSSRHLLYPSNESGAEPMELLEQFESESIDEFRKRVKETPLSFGIYRAADKTETFMCNFGNVGDPEDNNGLYYKDFGQHAGEYYEKYPEIFGEEGATGGNIVSYYIEFDTYYPDIIGLNDGVTNTGELYSEDMQIGGNIATYTINNGGGIGSVRRNELALQLVDKDTREPIEGAAFTVQQKKGDEWVDTAITDLKTDEDGMLCCGPFPKGEYRIVQKTWVDDYTKDINEFEAIESGTAQDVDEDGVFEISDLDRFGYGVIVTNQRPHILTIKPVEMTAYTGGTSLDADGFPAVRYRLTFSDGTTPEKLRLSFSEAEGDSIELTDLSKIQFIEGLEEVYIYNEDSVGANSLEDETKASAGEQDDRKPGIYTIDIANDITKLRAENENGMSYSIEFKPGRLTIRYVNSPEAVVGDNDLIAEPVLTATPSEAPAKPVAMVDPDTKFATNDIDELQLIGTELGDTKGIKISLLSDELLSEFGEDRSELLRIKGEQKLTDEGIDTKGRQYEFKYLDLVNVTDGNAWVSSSLGSYILWPYPEGTDKDTAFEVLHFKDLHREYSFPGKSDIEEAIASSETELVPQVENTDLGIKFYVGKAGFSPFAVSWIDPKAAEEEEGGDPNVPGGEEKPDPDVPGEEEKPNDPGEEKPDKPDEDEKPNDKPDDNDDKPNNPGGTGDTGGGGGGGGSTGGGGSSVSRPGYDFGGGGSSQSGGTGNSSENGPSSGNGGSSTIAEDNTPGYIPPHPEYNKLPVMGAEVLGPGFAGGIKLPEADGRLSILTEAERNAAEDSVSGASGTQSTQGTQNTQSGNEAFVNEADGNTLSGINALKDEVRTVIPELAGYYAQNNDLLGWIAVPGTGAGYPVMNDPELPTYYLHHTFDREADDVGIPFTAPFCTPDSDNILIHGHNMNGKLQFGNIWNYQYPSFREKHPVIDFKTIYDSESQYEVMAIFFAPVYPEEQTGVFKWYQYAGDMNKNQFEYYVQNVKALSLYDTGVTAEYGDKLITLETCANSHDSTRLVVVARKKLANSES